MRCRNPINTLLLFIRCCLLLRVLAVYGFHAGRIGCEARNKKVPPSSLSLQKDVIHQESARALSLSRDLLKGLHQHDSMQKAPVSLNVETDLYDPTTGFASLKLAALSQTDDEEELILDAIHIADSLWKYSWDGTSFRRRSYSGQWDHSFLDATKHDESLIPHQVNYYRESAEHRCIQHAIAVIFWSRLVEFFQQTNQEVYFQTYQSQLQHVALNLVEEFWSESDEKWFTTSKTQGGGDLLRLSASWGKPTEGVSEETNQKYFRAVDQAVALLACVELQSNKSLFHEQQENLSSVIDKICDTLLSSNGFGYGVASDNEKATKSYIGLQRNRNFWHDGWAVFALLVAAKKDLGGWTKRNKSTISAMVTCQLQSRYGTTEKGDLVWHWAPTEKPASENVRYCGDNALWYAIRQTMRDDVFPEWDQPDDTVAFWNFVKNLESPHPGNGKLVAVADVYPQVRLHPNTELAALVTWSL